MYKNQSCFFHFSLHILCHFIFTLNELNALVYRELPIKHYNLPSTKRKKNGKRKIEVLYTYVKYNSYVQ